MTAAVNNTLEYKKEMPSSIALLVCLISFSMLFATLFLGYSVFRMTSDTWPPGGMERIPLLIPTTSTLFVLSSSFFAYLLERYIPSFNQNKVKISYTLTFLAGMGFVVSQFNLWSFLKEIGIFTNSGIYPSMVYAFTWIHMGHLALGFVALIFMGLFLNKREWKLEVSLDRHKLGTLLKFWHFLGLIWLIMYSLLFVL